MLALNDGVVTGVNNGLDKRVQIFTGGNLDDLAECVVNRIDSQEVDYDVITAIDVGEHEVDVRCGGGDLNGCAFHVAQSQRIIVAEVHDIDSAAVAPKVFGVDDYGVGPASGLHRVTIGREDDFAAFSAEDRSGATRDVAYIN